MFFKRGLEMFIKNMNIDKIKGKFSYEEIKERIESGEINKEIFLKMSKNGDIGLLDSESIFLDGYFGLICNTSAHLSLKEIKILKASYKSEKERVKKWKEYKTCKLALLDLKKYIHKDNF